VSMSEPEKSAAAKKRKAPNAQDAKPIAAGH
jgi:hypothetical protein